MQKESILYGIIGLLLGSLITIVVASNAVNNNATGMLQMMGMHTYSGVGSFSMMAANIDAHFIEQMIPHHEDAISMAKVAQTKAQRPEIKQLAQNIISSQSQEIDQMKSWYKDWFSRELPTGSQVMSQHGMMGDTSDMTKLEQSADFDKAFIEEMIPHHQMAVMMASMLKNGTARPEMKKLADDIITAQTKEIDQMRQWYKER